jgi:NAD(P)-dependent dehydrogenase (short-subunit alcohol dehydrogenase family)
MNILRRLFSLEGKVALVTGAGGGIGRVLALALAESGAAVGLHDRSLALTGDVKRELEASGSKAFQFAADLADVEACSQLVEEARSAMGRLDVLVNCAAMNRRKPINEVTPDDFDAIVAVNLRSVFFLSQQAHRVMTAQGGGKIIHIGSINSAYSLDGVSVYGLTKGALSQLTRTMAVEWAKDNVQVNCIAPGFMRTSLSAPVWADAYRAAWLTERIPMRRPGEPDELVGMALLMASNASSYLTGTTVNVDGGVLAGGSWNTWQTQS